MKGRAGRGIFALLGVLLIPSVVSAQTSTTEAAAARKQIEQFRHQFGSVWKEKGEVAAIEQLYTPDFTQVMPNGTKVSREQILAAARKKPSASTILPPDAEEVRDGVTHIGLSEKDRSWRPDRFVLKGDEIIVYTSSVNKARQPMAFDADGKLKMTDMQPEDMRDAEIKTLATTKETYVKTPQGLRLRRVEVAGIKVYVNGVALPNAEIRKSTSPYDAKEPAADSSTPKPENAPE